MDETHGDPPDRDLVYGVDYGIQDEYVPLSTWASAVLIEGCIIEPIPGAVINVPDVTQPCPCGAPARPGNLYCGSDCVPNHRGIHTSGETEMRWRPDMVSTADDTGLELIVPERRYGNYLAEVFRRRGTDSLHLRLNDGYRFIGSDVAAGDWQPSDGLERFADKWAALERGFVNPRATSPSEALTTDEVDDGLQRWRQHLRERAQQWQPVSGGLIPPGALNPRFSRRVFGPGGPEHVIVDGVTDGLRSMRAHWAPLVDALNSPRAQGFFDNSYFQAFMGPSTPQQARPVDERTETLRRLRARHNTGPAARGRAPQRIDPRRGR